MRNCTNITAFCSWYSGMALTKMPRYLDRRYRNCTGSTDNNAKMGQVLKELCEYIHGECHRIEARVQMQRSACIYLVLPVPTTC